MASVRILSVNCQGLGNIVKRTDVFNYLKKKESSATSTVYKILISLVKMKRAYDQVGIMNVILAHLHQMPAILFNNNFEFNILKEKRDINGNYLVLDINVDKINFTLVSIYGPNDDNPQYYENIMSIVEITVTICM